MKTQLIVISLIALLTLLVFQINVAWAIEESVDIGPYKIDYEYSLDDAVAGEKFNLDVTITNEGDETRENINLEFDDSNPFDFDNKEEWEIGNLSTDESESKTFRIEIDDDAEDKEYQLEFKLEDNIREYEDELDIEVDSDKPELIIGDISSQPSIISPDLEDIKLTVTIENTGGGDAKFVKARIVLPDGFQRSSSFSDKTNLGTINEGESKDADFFIDSMENIDSGDFQATLQLEFEDSNDNNLHENLDFDIPIKGRPQFEISGHSTNPSRITNGQSGVEINIDIFNTGQEEGKETSIRVFESSDNPFEFQEKTQRIGSIDSGSSGSAIFTMDVESDAKPRTYLLKIQIRTVNDGNVIVKEDSIPVKVVKGERQSPLPYLLIGIPVLLIIILVVIIIRGPRKKEKKE